MFNKYINCIIIGILLCYKRNKPPQDALLYEHI